MGSLAFDSKETKILHIIMEMWPEWSNVREQDLRMELTEHFMPQTIHVNQAPKHNMGEGNGNRLQYSCLENPMDGGA